MEDQEEEEKKEEVVEEEDEEKKERQMVLRRLLLADGQPLGWILQPAGARHAAPPRRRPYGVLRVGLEEEEKEKVEVDMGVEVLRR